MLTSDPLALYGFRFADTIRLFTLVFSLPMTTIHTS